jgi:hypothetical protein
VIEVRNRSKRARRGGEPVPPSDATVVPKAAGSAASKPASRSAPRRTSTVPAKAPTKGGPKG